VIRFDDHDEAVMSHYIAIIVPTAVGEWRVLFPDVPGCETVGFTLEDARYAAVSMLKQRVEFAGAATPKPRTLNAIAKDDEWLSSNGVDLSKAIVEVVPVPDEPRWTPIDQSIADLSAIEAAVSEPLRNRSA
jgi:predicted RNase H-like HicB family nuclease